MLIIPDNKKLTVNQGGRRYVVTAVADNDRDANRHMERVATDGVLMVIGRLVVMADMQDLGEPLKAQKIQGGV